MGQTNCKIRDISKQLKYEVQELKIK